MKSWEGGGCHVNPQELPLEHLRTSYWVKFIVYASHIVTPVYGKQTPWQTGHLTALTSCTTNFTETVLPCTLRQPALCRFEIKQNQPKQKCPRRQCRPQNWCQKSGQDVASKGMSSFQYGTRNKALMGQGCQNPSFSPSPQTMLALCRRGMHADFNSSL